MRAPTVFDADSSAAAEVCEARHGRATQTCASTSERRAGRRAAATSSCAVDGDAFRARSWSADQRLLPHRRRSLRAAAHELPAPPRRDRWRVLDTPTSATPSTARSRSQGPRARGHARGGAARVRRLGRRVAPTGSPQSERRAEQRSRRTRHDVGSTAGDRLPTRSTGRSAGRTRARPHAHGASRVRPRRRTLAAHGADVLRVSAPYLPEIDAVLPDTSIGEALDVLRLRATAERLDVPHARSARRRHRAVVPSAARSPPRRHRAASSTRTRVRVAVGVLARRPVAARSRLDGRCTTRSRPAAPRPTAFATCGIGRGGHVRRRRSTTHRCSRRGRGDRVLVAARRSDARSTARRHVRCSLAQTREWLETLGRVDNTDARPVPTTTRSIATLPASQARTDASRRTRRYAWRPVARRRRTGITCRGCRPCSATVALAVSVSAGGDRSSAATAMTSRTDRQRRAAVGRCRTRSRTAACAALWHDAQLPPKRFNDLGAAAAQDLRALRRHVEREELPVVRRGAEARRALHHRLLRHELDDRADRIRAALRPNARPRAPAARWPRTLATKWSPTRVIVLTFAKSAARELRVLDDTVVGRRGRRRVARCRRVPATIRRRTRRRAAPRARARSPTPSRSSRSAAHRPGYGSRDAPAVHSVSNQSHCQGVIVSNGPANTCGPSIARRAATARAGSRTLERRRRRASAP